ncbi:MAG: outer membrane beta-barrel protein [Muribaculaceae bacterium]|nr:outer membrane beta-barrel protein [Muribaculaceae bacterium]
MPTTRLHHSLALMLLLAVATLQAPRAHAQEDYRFDFGAGLGMTGYLGDANTSNLFQNPSWDAELFLRYIINPRLALKTNFYVGGLRGNSEQMTNVFPDNKVFKFTTTFYEIGELFEFNFFEFGIGETYRKLKRITPYITAGLSATMWSVDKSIYGGLTIPLGIGVKYKPSKRLNLGLEFLMKKVFSDRLDGVAGEDLHTIKSSFAKNTDWYSTLTFTVSYEFSKRCATCNYKD